MSSSRELLVVRMRVVRSELQRTADTPPAIAALLGGWALHTAPAPNKPMIHNFYDKQPFMCVPRPHTYTPHMFGPMFRLTHRLAHMSPCRNLVESPTSVTN
jgi:hypothetical protein